MGPKLKGSFELDGSRFKRGMDEIKKGAKKSVREIESFGRGGGGIFDGPLAKMLGVVGGIAAITRFNQHVDQLIAKVRKLQDMTAATGLSLDLAQQLENLGGGDQAKSALEKIAEMQAKFKETGDLNIAKQFADLGVTLDDIKRKNHVQLFEQIGNTLKTVAMTGERLAALKQVFGEGNMLAGMFEDIGTPRATRGNLSENQIANIEKFAKASEEAAEPFTDFWEAFKVEASLLFRKAKIGISTVGRVPGMMLAGREGRLDSQMEIRQNLMNQAGQAKLDARAMAKAKAQIEAEERARADEKLEAERQKLAEQTAKLRAKAEKDNALAGIKSLEHFREAIGVAVDASRAGTDPAQATTAWQQLGASVRGGPTRNPDTAKLVELERQVIEQLKLANQKLNKSEKSGIDVNFG